MASRPPQAPWRSSLPSQVAGLLFAFAGALVLLGWALDIQLLRSPFQGLGYIKGNTAAGFILAGLATAAVAQRASRPLLWLGRTLAVLLIIGSSMSLLNLLNGATLGFHGLFVADDAALTGSPYPGQSSPNVSLGFILIGAALLLVHGRRERAVRAADVLCFLAGMNALTTAFAWAFDAGRIFGMERHTAMSMPTALLFLALCPAVVFARPEAGLPRLLLAGTAGGAAARRLLPAVILVPAVLKILNHWAIVGGLYGWRFGGAAETGTAVGLLWLLTWWSAEHLHEYDLERRRDERELRRLAALVDASNDAIMSIDVDGTIRTWNTGAVHLYGYTPEEALGQNASLLAGEPQDGTSSQERLISAMRSGHSARAEVKRRTKDGRILNVWISLSPIRDAKGAVIGGAAVERDTTERRRLEEIRESLLAEMRRAVHQRDEFLTVTAHELKTPLTSLLLELQSLKRRARRRPIDEEGVASRADRAIRGAERLRVLVDRLLELSRIHEGRLQLHPEEVELGEIATKVVERSRERARMAGSELDVEIKSQARGHWDRERLDEVIENLLENAVRFGEGHPIHVEVDGTDGGGRLIVRDRGRGVDEQDRERIFERFERASSPEEYGGIGLGLWLVREIVGAHGGDVHVETPQDGGTLFVVDLPSTPAAAGSESHEAQA